MTLVPAASEVLSASNRRLLEAVLKPLLSTWSMDAGEVIQSITAGMVRDSERWLDLQNRYQRAQIELWKSLYDSKAGVAQVIAPDPTDRRFRAAEWRNPYFSYLVQAYLLNARLLEEYVDLAQLETHIKKKLAFFVRQLIDAMSPVNFLWSNPEAIRIAFETGGESLARGLRNLAADLEKGLVTTTDENAFEVGRNLATTPGDVVFENDLIQLIQYRPATDTVFERPLVMVPPCINKFYILDLQPDNSFVRFAIEQGHTVFMVSWRNVPPAMGTTTWNDYLEQGVIRGISVAAEICGSRDVNALGFCVGGTLLASALAVMRARGEAPAASLTLLASMLDFSDTGELSVFVDEAYVKQRERDFAGGGVLPGHELAIAFASLRANELIWHYVAHNYLKGRTPEPFDMLYWNSDSTNLPGAMYVYYLRNMYLENNLRVPGKLRMCGVPVDLGTLDMPVYVLAAREDHIVPWKTAFASTGLLRGRIDFVLTASGHIAGVINPVSRNRRNYWLNSTLYDDAEQWIRTATLHPGSWWAHWSRWIAAHGGRRIACDRISGGGRYAVIEPAPGRYVMEKCIPLGRGSRALFERPAGFVLF